MENIDKLYESVTVPVTLLRAALSCASKDEDRFNMNGVFVHRVEDSVRLVGTDGGRALIASTDAPQDAPSWLDAGIIIDRAGLARAVGFLASIDVAEAVISYMPGAGRLTVESADCLFRVKPVEATFPDYQMVMSQLSFAGREVADMESAVFVPSLLKGAADVAKVLEADHVRLHSAENDGPSLITFPDKPNVVMVMMPVSQKTRALPAPTAKLVEGPLKGTIAALRAHQTRWSDRTAKARTQKDKAACEAKVEDYEARINALLGQLTVPALPAPETVAEAEPEIPAVVTDISLGEMVEPLDEPQLSLEEMVAKSRGELQGKRRSRAIEAFRTDINAVLGSMGLLAYCGLPDGYDIAPGFTAGLSPEQAANAWVEVRREELFQAWVIEATGEALPIDDETAALYREAFAANTAPEDLAGFIDSKKPQQLDEAAE